MLTVIVPVYNEVHTLGQVLAMVTRSLPGIAKQLIIVDDGSRDGTREWLQRQFPASGQKAGVIRLEADGNLTFSDDATAVTTTIVYHASTRGKGAGLRTGLACAQGDIIVFQDADLEYDPADWAAMYDLIAVRKVADVVYGSRFMGAPRRALAYHHYMANRLISLVFSICFNRKLTDVETCYKMMTRQVAQSMALSSDDFGIEVEITAAIARQRNLRFYEVAISYFGRTYDEGKKINWRDGLKAFWYIAKFRLARS